MIPKWKQLAGFLCLAAAFILSPFAVAGPILDGITNVAATLKSDGSTNLWTEADLVDALGLLNRRYWRDMGSDEGRKAWHGAVAASAFHAVTNGQSVVPVRVDTYADGFVHSTTGTARRVLTPAESAALMAKRRDARARRLAGLQSSLAAYEATIAQGVGTNDAQRLAYARAVVAAEAARNQIQRLETSGTTNHVTVVVVPQTGE